MMNTGEIDPAIIAEKHFGPINDIAYPRGFIDWVTAVVNGYNSLAEKVAGNVKLALEELREVDTYEETYELLFAKYDTIKVPLIYLYLGGQDEERLYRLVMDSLAPLAERLSQMAKDMDKA
jgi:hypothetical protein